MRRGGGQHSRHQTFDSNGPDVKVRGSANQIFEKYLLLARDANAMGDRVTAENYLQHAEHYCRIVNAHDQGPKPGGGQQPPAGQSPAEQQAGHERSRGNGAADPVSGEGQRQP